MQRRGMEHWASHPTYYYNVVSRTLQRVIILFKVILLPSLEVVVFIVVVYQGQTEIAWKILVTFHADTTTTAVAIATTTSTLVGRVLPASLSGISQFHE